MKSDLPPKIQERLRQRGSNSNKTSSIYQGSSDGKEATCSTGALGLILGSGRSPGEGNGYPLHYYTKVILKGKEKHEQAGE